jgi:DHA2 family multidrug resistance protein
VLLSTSLTALLIPLSQADRLGWDDLWIRLSFVLSFVTFTGFVWREMTAKSPMLDLSLFRSVTFSAAVGLRAAMGMGYYFAIFLLPLFTQDVMSWPPTISGLVLIPGGLATAFLMPLSGWLADKIGSRVLVFSGMALAAYGSFMFVHLDTSWTPGHIALDLVVRSAALGLLFTPLTTAALSVVPRHRTGSASGILNTVWQVAGSLGIAVGQTYLTSRTAVHMSDNAGVVTAGNAAATSALATMSGELQRHGLPASGAQQMLAGMADQIASIQAYGDTFILAAVVLAVATPLALLLGAKRPAKVAATVAPPIEEFTAVEELRPIPKQRYKNALRPAATRM